jgi:hypothetical protein
MSADENDFDLFLVKSLELFGDVGSRRIARKYAVIEIASYQEEVWPVLKGKVDQDLEGVLKVALPFESSRTILDRGRVEMVVCGEKDVNRHYTLSSQATRTVRMPVQLLASILNLEAAEPEAS